MRSLAETINGQDRTRAVDVLHPIGTATGAAGCAKRSMRARTRETVQFEAMKAWEKAFFESEFTPCRDRRASDGTPRRFPGTVAGPGGERGRVPWASFWVKSGDSLHVAKFVQGHRED